MSLGLGIDTGGTYTDAVIMDLDSGEVVSKAKSPTTREDLCIGIRGAVGSMDPDVLEEVGLVALSSTLATNSVVEGKGCRVALVGVGKGYDDSVHVDRSVEVAGGHNLHGGEERPLDEGSVRIFLESIRGDVDALAVNSVFSVRNPEHENRVRAMAREILGVPVVCGHELSSSLGFNQRVSTCVMNARLIPVMDELIRTVNAILAEYRVGAPLLIVRGNGSMMTEDVARERPIEAVMSGPTASLMGAMRLTGLRDAIVMDMGGTTTDIGVLRDGRPRLDTEGMVIEGRRTHITAARITTAGIGGDSRIMVNGRGNVLVDPERVVPLCVAATRWPEVGEHLAHLMDHDVVPSKRSTVLSSVMLGHEMFRTLRFPDCCGMAPHDIAFMHLALESPVSTVRAGAVLGVHPSSFDTHGMIVRGYVQRIGLTPTDLLHIGGEYTDFDADASRAGAEYLAAKAGTDPEGFVAMAREAVRVKLGTALMEDLLDEELGTTDLGPAGRDLLMKAVTGRHGRDFGCRVKVDKPIVGIGAPSGVYMRWVGEMFDTEVIVQPDADVGNAVGAVSSSLMESMEFVVMPEDLDEEGSCFQVFSRLGAMTFETLDRALSWIGSEGTDHLRGLLEACGAESVTTRSERTDRTVWGRSGEVLAEARVTVTAVGKPRPFR